jgi:hypothetical protein
MLVRCIRNSRKHARRGAISHGVYYELNFLWGSYNGHKTFLTAFASFNHLDVPEVFVVFKIRNVLAITAVQEKVGSQSAKLTFS